MQESLAVMQTALRILTAITENRLPDPADVVALHSYAGPQPEGYDLDEFACAVIQEAMKRRAEVRAAGRNSN
jgi:hypothetical protein